MSLVIARQWGSMIAIVGDTHLVHPYGERVGLLQGIIKTRILTDELCVSFAGSLYWAELALKEVDARSAKDASTVKAILSRIHNDSDGAVDFIVAEGASKPLLTLIKNREAHNVTVAWLGSASGFGRFQSAASEPQGQTPQNSVSFEMFRLPEGPNARNKEYSALIRRMRAVIEAPEVPEVGGFIVPVGLHNGRFEYMDYATVLTHPIQFDLMPEQFVVPFGTAAEGGYAFNLMNSMQDSQGLAVYALQGCCGAAFVPINGLLRPTLLANLSPVEFEDEVAKRFQLQVRSMFSTPDEFVARAMKKLEAGDLDAALREAERAVSRSNKQEPSSYRCRGLIHATRGELTPAIDDFSRALDIDPNHAPTWDNRGIANARLGHLERARSDFSQALNVDRHYARGYRHRAMVARLQNDEAQALEDERALGTMETDIQ